MSGRVHLVGIGGAGLSAIARVLHERGETVTGSDMQPSRYAHELERAGVSIAYEHRAENVAGAEMVIVSSAVPEDNPEIVAAHQAGIPVKRRQDYLGQLTSSKETIAVAGTHGKTTTTGLITWILVESGYDPSYILGGWLTDLGSNGHAGSGSHFVIEADEYDRAFLGLSPRAAVITNIEHDHPDCYPTPHDFFTAFEQFVGRVEDLLVVCQDDSAAASLESAQLERRSFGLAADADWRAIETQPNAAGGLDFKLLKQGELQGDVRTTLPGAHNVRNVLGAMAVSEWVGVTFEDARRAVAGFHGVERRFQVLGESGGVTVIDDYAHHPTEIRSTLSGARMRFPGADLWAVFQPHTYSRMRTFQAQLVDAFEEADHVIVLDVFAAREEPDPQVSGAWLAEAINHADVHFEAKLDRAAAFLLEAVMPGSVVISLSAGDGNRVTQHLLDRLREREGVERDEV